MILLSDSVPQSSPGVVGNDFRAASHAAWLQGFRVITYPKLGDDCASYEAAFSHVSVQPRMTRGVLLGFIPSPTRYREIFEAAARRNIILPNTPTEHLVAEEFDRNYSMLAGLTPESRIVRDAHACAGAVRELGLPVFLKGVVKSHKEAGPRACIAHTLQHAVALSTLLLNKDALARGRVVVRRYVKLRSARCSPNGFPLGREFRVFAYRERILALGYQWPSDDPLRELNETERAHVVALAAETARRVRVPYITVDIAQMENGDWTVIEIGDAQFAGSSGTPRLSLWWNLRDAFGDAGPDSLAWMAEAGSRGGT